MSQVQKPTVGRIVHYTLPIGSAGNRSAGQVRPLIVTQVFENGAVNGKVILDGVNDLGHDDHAYTASYSETGEHGTWSWPPRV